MRKLLDEKLIRTESIFSQNYGEIGLQGQEVGLKADDSALGVWARSRVEGAHGWEQLLQWMY